MKANEHLKGVIAAFVILAVAVVGLLAVYVYRSAHSPKKGIDAQAMTDMASQKDLAEALKDPARREQAIRSMGERRDGATADLLAALGQQSADPDVRAAALTALGAFGDAVTPPALQVVTIGVRDGNVSVRLAAVGALGRMTNAVARAAIAEGLMDLDNTVRLAAATTLAGGVGAPATLDALLKALTDDDDPAVRAQVALALGRFTAAAARRALITALMADVDPSVRLAAAEALAAVRDADRITGLACGLGNDKAEVAGRAAKLLPALESGELPAMGEALHTPELRRVLDGAQGAAAAAALCARLEAHKSVDAAVPLVRLLDVATGAGGGPRYADTQSRCVAALGAIGPSALPALAEVALRPDARLALKQAAAKVLAAVGAPAVEPLRAYVEARTVLPGSDEAALWARTLEAIGGDAATACIASVRARDPEQVFRQYAAAAPTASPAARAPAPQLEEFSLTLHGGIYPGNPPTAYARRTGNLPFARKTAATEETPAKYEPTSRASIALDLVRLATGWGRVVGHSGAYFNSITFGRAERLAVTDQAIDGDLKLNVGDDPWMQGGYGEYTVALTRQPDGSYRGTYRGRYRDVPVEGVATCVRKPGRAPLRAGFRPVEPGEHPRLLFRKDDLPRLRARLTTPMGRVAFQRLATAEYVVRHESASYVHVALGLLYQLTGDPAYAAQAVPMVEREMADRDFGFMGLGQVWGGRFGNIALAYDLCYDAWPAAFRATVDRYLVNASAAAATHMAKFSSCANTHPCSNYFSPIVGGASTLALAYWMDPGPPPAAPGGTRLLEPPMAKAPPGEGVPVGPLAGGDLPSSWLWSGPVYIPSSPAELIECLGDTEADPVRAGRTFTLGGSTFEFGAPPADIPQRDGIYPWMAISREKPDCTGVGMLLYTVVDNRRPGFYSLHLPGQGASECLIGGMRVPGGAYVRLDAGLYPVLVAFTGDANTMVPVGARFRFVTDSRAEMDTLMAANLERLKGKQLVYELDLADHRATGMDGSKLNTLQMTLAHMVRSHRLLMGSGGFQSEGEGYTHTADTPVRYAAACWNVFGQTLSPYPDATHFPARYIATGVLRPQRGKPPVLVAQSFNGGELPSHGLHFICPGFAYTPEAYQPALLWVWNRLTGVEDGKPETFTRLVDDEDLETVIYTFVNYPLDMKPVAPGESFPKTWQAVDKGLYVFRSRWQDNGDVVLQIYANELMSKGHGQPDAAGMRLHGLGYDWTSASPGKHEPYRWLQNVVFLPEDDPERRSSGRVTSWRAETNGSGHVSINLDLEYKRSAEGRHDAVGIWPPDPPEPGEVRGLRAVAADYSGACGAPALFAIVDRVEGGGERKWLWHLPDAGWARAEDARVETGPNTFTIRQGAATLRAVFVTPGNASVEAPGTILARHTQDDKYAAQLKKDKNFKPDPEPTPVDIVATSPAGESFFVVMTMQEGDAPEVVVEKGSGLNSVIRVGQRRIRFDGERVMIEGP